jgi:hypothetical protein
MDCSTIDNVVSLDEVMHERGRFQSEWEEKHTVRSAKATLSKKKMRQQR